MFQDVIKTGDISWDDVDYLCKWQSEILNNAKFSEEDPDLDINNYLQVSHHIKQDNDDCDLNKDEDQSEQNVNKDTFTDEDETEQDDPISIPVTCKRVKNSVIHEHFHKVKLYHPVSKKPVNGSICKYCKAKFTNRVSTNLKSHLMSKHPQAFEEVQSKLMISLVKFCSCPCPCL